MNKFDTVTENVLSHKRIPRGKVRCLDKSILRLAFLGHTVKEIVEKTGKTDKTVRDKLNNPAMQAEIKRLDKLADVEVVRVDIASKRKIREASMKAVGILIDEMDSEKAHTRMKAAIKVLEYAHGKPHQQVDIKAKVVDELTDDESESLKDDGE